MRASFERMHRSSRISVSAIAIALLAAGCAGAEDRVHPEPGAVEPLPAGAQVPEVTVTTLDGARFDLAEALRSRGALLVFFRGGW